MQQLAKICHHYAAMAELVDALDSGSSRGNSVDVRVILAACVLTSFTLYTLMTRLVPSHFPLPLFAHMQSIALVANGAVHDMPWIAEMIKDYPGVVAVDGGLSYCHKIGVTPSLIIGDLDSLSADLLNLYADIPLEKFPVDKDWTDLDLAVYAVNSPSMKKITVFGALEGETAHALNNLQLARRYPGKLFIETEQETVMALQGTTVLNVTPGQTLSLVPLGTPAVNVTTEGLKWELRQATLDKDYMSISNVCTSSQVKITIGEGDLMCCLLRTSLQC